MSDKIMQIKDYPYFYTDGEELYTNVENYKCRVQWVYRPCKYRKLSGWKKNYLGQLVYPIKKENRNINTDKIYFFKDDLKSYL
jgi:hypothetical protein